MAGKPFLSHLRGKKGKYKVNRSSEADKENHMEGKYRQTTSDTEPPQKKRKTENKGAGDGQRAHGAGEAELGEDFWDDSMEFTQADLEDLEVQATQAYKETAQKSDLHETSMLPQPSTSAVGGSTTREPVTFLKPQLSRSSSSGSGHHTGTSNTSNNTLSRSSHSTSGRSSHASNSSHGSHSSHSSYPASLSYSSTSSSSLKSGSSIEDISHRVGTGSLSRGLSSESLDMSAIVGRSTTGNQPSHEDIATMKQECAALQLKLSRMQEEMCVRDGENRLLRDNLRRREEELSEARLEKFSEMSQQARQQSDKEKALQTELSRIQTQLQFKEQEEREMKTRCRDLEAQLRSLQTATSSSQPTHMSPKKPVHLSPKPSRTVAEEGSPRNKSSFPTAKTFQATEGSPSTSKNKAKTVRSQAVKLKLDERRLCTRLKTTRHSTLSGPQLVARLFCAHHIGIQHTTRTGNQQVTGENQLTVTAKNQHQSESQQYRGVGGMNDRGFVALLSMPTTLSRLYNVQLDRDRHTSLLSPARGGLAAFQAVLARHQEEGTLISLVTDDHFQLAMQGLTNLLTLDSGPGKSDQHEDLTTVSRGHDIRTAASTISESHQCQSAAVTPPSVLDSAILVLPLLNDYLHHYIDMLGSALETSNTSTRGSSSSSFSSSDPSLESVSGSLGFMIKSTVAYANDLESLALASLQTLCNLLTCDGVRSVLMYREEKGMEISNTAAHETSSSELEVQVKEKSENMSQIPLKAIRKLSLLKKVIRLSNPGSKENICNMKIVTTCLKILEILATHASESQMKSLMGVLSEEGLQHCIGWDSQPGVVTGALGVLRAMCCHNQVVSSLCTNTTGCVLLSMYGLCTPDVCLDTVTSPKRLEILSLVVGCVMVIASNHKGGLTVLLESDCQCSVEVVKTIVCLLHSVMLSYLEDLDQGSSSVAPGEGNLADRKLRLLQEGLLVLHLMAQNDTNFTNRHLCVQHQYVQLVCGLTRIFKALPEDCHETEMTMLQDLWDFDHDDSELSQDSDTEDDGDTDRSDIQMEVS